MMMPLFLISLGVMFLSSTSSASTGNSKACRDSKEYYSACKGWKRIGFCDRNHERHGFMRDHCPSTCKFCKEICENSKVYDKSCNGWENAGFCAKSHSRFGFMFDHCRKTCRFCEAGVCEDSEEHIANCQGWKKAGFCERGHSRYGFMRDHCSVTCGFCQGSKPCIDKRESGTCNSWKAKGYCKKENTFYPFMTQNCNSTCGFCTRIVLKVKEHCDDESRYKQYCGKYKALRMCDEQHAQFKFVSKNCRRTCGLCGEKKKEVVNVKQSLVCKDTDKYASSCAGWKRVKFCERNNERYGFMQDHCRLTCGFCSSSKVTSTKIPPIILKTKTKTGCQDTREYAKNCAGWKRTRLCNRDHERYGFMKDHCSKTCGFCTPKGGFQEFRISRQIDEELCGISSRGRIVGGEVTTPGSWPWIAAIARVKSPTFVFCAASLVNNRWLVTAAHCFSSTKTPTDFLVRLSEHDINNDEGEELVVGIDKIIVHKNYDATDLDYDIALLRMERPVPYSTTIKPICIPKAGEVFHPGKLCYIKGWGRVAEFGRTSNVLLQAKVPIVTWTTCRNSYARVSNDLTRRMMCAGVSNGSLDACEGDSGGPLACESTRRFDKRYVQAGVVSWGIGCGRKNVYGVYTEVKQMTSWINANVY